MSNKNGDEGVTVAPFFANLLSSQKDPAQLADGGGGPAPTFHCLDSPCTKKYPSDDDESTTWFNDRDS